jgi:hypothetical protein
MSFRGWDYWRKMVTSSCTNFRTLITTSLVCEIFPCKGKRCPATRYEGAWGERRYSSYSFSTSALDEGEWSASRPGRALPPGKGPPVPIG